MISRTREAWLVVACLSLAFSGCNKALHFEKTLSMGPGDVKSFSVDAPRREQHVTVAFTSSAAPVDVFVVLEKDLEPAATAIQSFKKPEGILAKLEKSKSGSVEAVIPGKAGFGVIVAGPIRDTSVEVKLTGK